MTPEQDQALEVARGLAGAGVPIFIANPEDTPLGYKLPARWQQTKADPAVVDLWQPGMALAAVMGCGLDLLDVDPRSGGDLAALNGRHPTSYGTALTPSGGVHSFIRSMGVHSRDNVLPGVDVKAGAADGKGRGFAFIAPTVRVSKTTGQPTAYRWATLPDLTRLAAALSDPTTDLSGSTLATLIADLRRKDTSGGGTVEDFLKVGPLKDVAATLAGGRNQGVAKIAAALRGRGGWRLEDALEYMYAKVWPEIDQTAGGHEFTADEFETTIKAAWRQYDDGKEQREAEAAIPPTPDAPPPNPGARYFGEGGLQAATLAGDVMSLGPVALGSDNLMWSYSGGVWRPDRHVVRNRLARLMGQRHRSGHTTTVADVVQSYCDTITCDPVERYINFRNGLLDWRTGELHPHSPDVPSTVQLSVDYDPGADCPAFEKFLAQVIPQDMIDTVWELIGYLMYSGNPLHKAIMLTGVGRNGKGTLLRVLLALLGKRNVTTISLHDLVNTRFATASLFGMLANIAGDIDGTYLDQTATFKGITGGDTINAEHKGKDRFDFTPWATLVFSANKVPASADTTVGYLSRWLVVPFPHNFTGHEDRKLDAKLTTEAELRGIAARGVAALSRLLERGDFELSESALAARDEFVRRVDQVATWLYDCAETGPDLGWVARTELYEAYKRWAARDGHRPVRASEFYDRLEAIGAEPATIHGTRGFKRIRVLDDGWLTFQGAATPPENRVQPPAEPAATSPKTSDAAATPPVLPENGLHPGGGLHPAGIVGLTCENTQVTDELGAEGAAHSAARNFWDLRGVRKSGEVWRFAAPSAPNPARAAAKLEARLAAITEAAGPVTTLPVAVTRNGTVRPLGHTLADRLLETITSTDQPLTVDVETTGYPLGHADYALRTIQLGNASFAVVLDATDADQAEVARHHLGAATRLHAHSATADLVPLAYAGLLDADDGWARMHDTVIAAKLSDPASTGSDPGLKRLAATVLGDAAASTAADEARAALFKAGRWLTDAKVTTPAERSGWAQVDPASTTMIRYAAADVLDTAELARRLPWPPSAVLERERIAQRMTARVTHDGLRIDAEHVVAMLARHTESRARHAERVRAFGVDNPGSGAQVAAVLATLGATLPRTATGRASVAEGVLEPLRATQGQIGELAAAVLDYRHDDTVVGTFLEPYYQLVTRGDGRARPTVYTLGADTGRMSCVRPNLQQLPREGGVRACITADDGQLLISADFSGVELRVAAALSQDANLARMLAAGADLHWEAARQVFGPDATKADRYRVKRGVFGWLYGGSVSTLAKQMGVNEQTAGAMVDTLAHLAPGLTEWTRHVSDAVKAGRTRFPTYSGRIAHMPKRAPHAGPNYCIQGTARELLIDALLRWRDTRWGSCVLLPVHDELLVAVPEDEAAEATEALQAAMTQVLNGVAIIAEASSPSFAWQDAS